MKQDIYFCKTYNTFRDMFRSPRIWRSDGKYEPFVYILKCNKTNRYYIGSRTQYLSGRCLETDIGNNYFSSSSLIKDIWKLDRLSFDIVQIIRCASNHDAFIMEILTIKIHDAVYNDKYINKGHPCIGFCLSGLKFTEEHKNKIGNAVKKAALERTPEQKEELSKQTSFRQIKRFENEEERNKISKTLKLLYSNGHYDDFKLIHSKRISDLHKMGHYNDAYLKISEANKDRKKPNGFGEKISKAKKGWDPSPSTRQKMSEARKGKYMGADNIMSNAESRNKVGKSKLGRKRVYLKAGSFIYAKAEDLPQYYLHSNGKYYDYKE